ncbi:MAG: ComEA family DNA-binding protein [Ruthenibacterium sp.]|jgi:competence ComEA-like helix-hairpin-helix protein
MREFLRRFALPGWYAVFCGALALVVFAVLAAELPPLYQNIRPVTPEAYFYRTDEHLDINTASAAELELIDGIGPVKAQRIIEYRAAHGPFASVEELALINGISDETVQAAKEVAVALPPKPGVQ